MRIVGWCLSVIICGQLPCLAIGKRVPSHVTTTPDLRAIRKQFAAKDAEIERLREKVADLEVEIAELQSEIVKGQAMIQPVPQAAPVADPIVQAVPMPEAAPIDKSDVKALTASLIEAAKPYIAKLSQDVPGLTSTNIVKTDSLTSPLMGEVKYTFMNKGTIDGSDIYGFAYQDGQWVFQYRDIEGWGFPRERETGQ